MSTSPSTEECQGRVHEASSESGTSSLVVTSEEGTKSRVSIFIVTHAKDKEWLKFCLRSIAKFATGFHRTVVVVPERDKFAFVPIIEESVLSAVELKFSDEPPNLGHLHHLVVKSTADVWEPDADFIMHVDADCLFREPITPASYFVDGKPVMLIEPWEKIQDRHDPEICWREPTVRALGFDPGYETMRRLPIIYNRRLYLAMRKHMEETHKLGFEPYVMKQRPIFPYGFCEFNALGGFALNARNVTRRNGRHT